MSTVNYLQEELYELVKRDATIFDFLQNTSLDGLWFADLQQPANDWINVRFWENLGYDPGQVPPDPGIWRQLANPDDLAASFGQVSRCLADPALSYDQVVRYRHLDGSTVWLRCQGLLLLRDADGTPTRMLGGLRNITKEKLEEARAREVMGHYRSLLSSQSVYIIKTDAEGRYTYANDSFYAQFGLSSKVIGTSSLDSIAVEDHEKCLDAVRRCFAEPEVSHQVVLRKPYRDGVVRSNHWEFKGIRDEQGAVVEILCLGYDNTQLVDNLLRSQHLLDVTSQQNLRLQEFAYITSHNIRSHSANLTSLVQLLAGAKSPEKQALFLQMLTTSTEKLAETIVNLNDIVAVHRDVSKPRESRLLKTELDRTLEVLSALIQQQQISVRVEVPADVTVTVVPAYLDSILLNLVSNALKYRSPERPAQITLSARREAGFVVLAVQDNGLGLDLAKNRDKLFGMYKTFHANEDARGVGLFITKNQIEAMQGRIEVESTVGVGSTFTVYFNETR